MSLLDRIKRRLPIVGQTPPPPAPRPAAAAPRTYVEREAPPPPASARGDKPVAEYVAEVVKAHPVVLFMKGVPNAPLCGFSATAAGILTSYGKVHAVDVIADPEVREGVKQFSNWPTIPQIFVGGEFVGGADILRQLEDSGELKALIEKANAPVA